MRLITTPNAIAVVDTAPHIFGDTVGMPCVKEVRMQDNTLIMERVIDSLRLVSERNFSLPARLAPLGSAPDLATEVALMGSSSCSNTNNTSGSAYRSARQRPHSPR
jgi:hypothetical protein